METNNFETLVAFPTHIYTIEKPEFLNSVRVVSADYLKDTNKAHDLYIKSRTDLRVNNLTKKSRTCKMA